MEIEVAGGDGIKIDRPSVLAKLAATIKQAKNNIFTRTFHLPRMFLQMHDDSPNNKSRLSAGTRLRLLSSDQIFALPRVAGADGTEDR